MPSGVSYMLENRLISKRAFADLFQRQQHPARRRLHRRAARAAAASLAPDVESPRRRGAHARASTTRPTSSTPSSPSGWASTLVEGRDLFVDDDDCVYMRTIAGPQQRRRDLPAHRRPVPRPRGVPARLRARRARADAGVAGGQRRPSPTRPAPAWPTTRSCTPGCPTSSATTSARSRSSRTCRRTAACTADERALRARPHRRAGGEAGQRERRLRPADRQPGDRASELAARVAAIEADPRNWVAQPILIALDGADPLRRGIEPRHVDLRPVHPHRPHELRDRGRAHAGRAARGLARRELLARAAAARTPGSSRRSVSALMLLSRVAENLYWAARYLERAEDTARHRAGATPNLIVDLPTRCPRQWEPLLAITGSASSFDARYERRRRGHDRALPRRRPDQPGSVLDVASSRRGRTCAPPGRSCPARRGRR